jgi:5-methylcytosine-specific restriction endonuclease McrA
MTKDHIIPRSHGGPTNWENLQTMCSICNGKKGGRLLHAGKHVKKDPLIIQPPPPPGLMENIQGKAHFL